MLFITSYPYCFSYLQIHFIQFINNHLQSILSVPNGDIISDISKIELIALVQNLSSHTKLKTKKLVGVV